LKEKIVGPFVLGMAYPELSKNAVVCVTETTSRAEIEEIGGWGEEGFDGLREKKELTAETQKDAESGTQRRVGMIDKD